MTRHLEGTTAGKLLALAGLVLIVVVVTIVLVMPVMKWSDTLSTERANAIIALEKLQSIVRLGKELDSQSSQPDVEIFRPDFLRLDQDAIVVADLQTRLSAILVGKNSELSSASALPAKFQDGQNWVGLRLQIRGEMKNIHEFLHAIEYATPYLFVARAEIRLEEQRGAVVDDPEGTAPWIFAELDVFGATWPAEATARSAHGSRSDTTTEQGMAP